MTWRRHFRFADKVILIEDAGIFSKAGDELGEYLKNSPESTHFIFVEESVDKRSKLYKAAAKCGNPVEFKEQTDETLARWIGMRIRKDGKGMSQAAYNSFIEKPVQIWKISTRSLRSCCATVWTRT